MSQADVLTSPFDDGSSGRWFFLRRPLRWLRRTHLYLGLCLLPWTLLYAVTAFLFNHPGVFSDVPLVFFGQESTRGTPLEKPLNPAVLAQQVVDALNRLQHPAQPYERTTTTPARFNREFAFATVAGENQSIGILIDVANGGGTIRASPKPVQEESEPAPFATGAGPSTPAIAREAGRSRTGPEPSRPTGLMLANPFHERMKAAIPRLLAQNGFADGEITVTSVPDLVFDMRADGKQWTVTFNSMTGAVSGKPAKVATEVFSPRRFLLRLHLAHGFPGGLGARWFWALVVDVTALVLVFWCASGLIMWWQIKSTRLLGLCLLILSCIAAGLMALGMYGGMA